MTVNERIIVLEQRITELEKKVEQNQGDICDLKIEVKELRSELQSIKQNTETIIGINTEMKENIGNIGNITNKLLDSVIEVKKIETNNDIEQSKQRWTFIQGIFSKEGIGYIILFALLQVLLKFLGL